MKMSIHRNIATRQLEIRVTRKINGVTSALRIEGNSSWLEILEGSVIEPTMSVEYNTEIQTDISDSNYKQLLSQKDEDKKSHIENLNYIIGELLKDKK